MARRQALRLATEAAEADEAGQIDQAFDRYVQAGEQLLASIAVATDPADVTAIRAKALECIERAEAIKQQRTAAAAGRNFHQADARSASLPAATAEPALPLFPIGSRVGRCLPPREGAVGDLARYRPRRPDGWRQ